MKKYNYLIIVLMVFMLVLTSCKSGTIPGLPTSSTSSSSSTSIPIVDYKTGILTPSITLDKVSTTTKVILGDAFNVGIKIHNKGAYKINNGVLRVIYDPFFIDLKSPEMNTYTLEGKSQPYPDGDFVLEVLDGKTNTAVYGKSNLQSKIDKDALSKLVAISEKYTSEIAFLFEFPYKTELSYDFCINPSSGANIGGQANNVQTDCYNSKTFSFSGQGAPIAIKSIDMNILPFKEDKNLARFEITVKDGGKGVLLGDLKINAKLSQLNTKCVPWQQDKIKTSKNPVKEYKYICEALVSANSAPYSTKFDIELDYYYAISYKHKLYIEPRYISKNLTAGKSITGLE